MIAQMDVRVILALIVRVLELVDRVILRFTDDNRERSSRFSDTKKLKYKG
jgi:hypothetical protein